MLAQLIAWWIRVPSILLLLGFGVLLGVWMNPDTMLEALEKHDVIEHVGDIDGAEKISEKSTLGPKIVFPLVSLAVAVILFEGGLSLRFHELKDAVGGAIVRLCTIGVVVSWAIGELTGLVALRNPMEAGGAIGCGIGRYRTYGGCAAATTHSPQSKNRICR